ncbi:hypothetical protein DVA67_001150 [Solirubrobacter sp. CPCC 204708]|uniref:DUF1707 domain-containing protein n=1 Tax=Solirubrobacter deserti TaxID=2282478 RepID=A0ABT4RE16_9ACTN|nr:hypothetical protein [Solirubrobacter deserti]MBE2314566.1 hypothetical protein [Solirubrobacter deserti]MDA0136570.1 DUF1707 domain-containing protein [Solirubrobacter deserti]
MPTPEQDRVATVLGRHYAADRLDASELDRRLDLTFGGALTEALADLPPLPSEAAARKRRWGRRHGEADAAQPTWVPTKERFIDPGSDRVMRVWVDPADHKRHYVPD